MPGADSLGQRLTSGVRQWQRAVAGTDRSLRATERPTERPPRQLNTGEQSRRRHQRRQRLRADGRSPAATVGGFSLSISDFAPPLLEFSTARNSQRLSAAVRTAVYVENNVTGDLVADHMFQRRRLQRDRANADAATIPGVGRQHHLADDVRRIARLACRQ